MPPGAAPFTWIFIAAQAAQPAARPALTIADQGYFFVAGQYTEAKKNNFEITALLRRWIEKTVR